MTVYQKLVLITEHQNGWLLFLHVYGCWPLPLRRPIPSMVSRAMF